MHPKIIRLCVAVALSMSLCEAASAHAHLKSATPAENAIVAAAPAAVQLQFTEPLELKFSGAALTGRANEDVAAGPVSFAAGADNTLQLPITGPMPPGEYTVRWHVLSRDGHKAQGSYNFIIQP